MENQTVIVGVLDRGLPAVWISKAQKDRAAAMGYTVVDAESVVATHLTEVIRSHAAEILTREQVTRLLDNLKESSAHLVEEVHPKLLATGEVQKVLQSLLRERVSIRNLEAILEALGDCAARTKDAEILTEYARNALGRAICRSLAEPDGKLYVVSADPKMEDVIDNSPPTPTPRIVAQLGGHGRHLGVVASTLRQLRRGRSCNPSGRRRDGRRSEVARSRRGACHVPGALARMATVVSGSTHEHGDPLDTGL